MPNLNSVNQLLMRALLGMQFIPKHLNAATANIPAVVFTGAGLNDATSGGTYTALVDHTYEVKISTAAGTDKFQWRKDGGAWSGEVSITGSAQNLSEGVQITFAATTGHTLNNLWTITVTAGVAVASAQGLGNIAINQVGNGATLVIYDGDSSDGDILYEGVTAAWTAGELISLGYALQNALGLYIVLYAVTTYPKVIVGYN